MAYLIYHLVFIAYMLHRSDNRNFVEVKIANEIFNEVERNLPVLKASSVSGAAERVLTDYLNSKSLGFGSRGPDDGK